MSSSLLVVLYACELENSKSLKSLSLTKFDFSSVTLHIWNNGPNTISQNGLSSIKSLGFQDVKLTQSTKNEALSKIYNSFIKLNPAINLILLFKLALRTL